MRHSSRINGREGAYNSNCLAIAPTATISNIVGVSQSIEPAFQNLYVKSNMSGEFTVVNPALVADLKARGLWDEVMISDLKYHDGALGPIRQLPACRPPRGPGLPRHRALNRDAEQFKKDKVDYVGIAEQRLVEHGANPTVGRSTA